MKEIKLTQYSHGAGCGCKISPKLLDEILAGEATSFNDRNLVVGNSTKDDAAVYALDDENAIISTTDFFMPIVDDPFDFGAIAATNAISDVYAMGGRPIMAISILGWPVDKLGADIAREVIEGAKSTCNEAEISLAGGHSIDTPEPIYGLAVTGKAALSNIKTNDQATVGSKLYLTKPLGIGILTTAQKKGLLKPEDLATAKESMLKLNKIGQSLGEMKGVSALTDVTGFGLLGHLIEICEGSNLSANIEFKQVPIFDCINWYIEKKCFPGGTQRNFDSYGYKVERLTPGQKSVLCDPQTSGGLLVAVKPQAVEEVEALFSSNGLALDAFGELVPKEKYEVAISG